MGQYTAAMTAEALQSIRNKLLDLTLRNKLINYRESARSIRIVDELPNAIIDKLIDDGLDLDFLPRAGATTAANELPLLEPDAELEEKYSDGSLQTTLSADKLESRLRNASLEAQRAIQETGANLLYLTMGFLEWTDKESDRSCRAPLILIPVELQRRLMKRKGPKLYHYVLRYNEEDMSANYSLARKLLEDFGLVLPPLEEDPEDIEPEAYFEQVRDAISSQPDWRIAREMVIDFFSFAKLFMFLDLDPTNWPDHVLIDNKSVRDLLIGCEDPVLDVDTTVYDVDHDERAEELKPVFEADSAQMSAMLDVLDGGNLVIEGPPGTGKSQTITNLIATALGQKKRILFLSEKMAALEVVQNRLARAGLGDFVLELHSRKTNKRNLIADVRARIESKYNYSGKDPELVAELDACRDQLNLYHELMNRPIAAGRTAEQIFWAIEEHRPPAFSGSVPCLNDARDWTTADLAMREELVIELDQGLGGKIPQTSHWYGFYPIHLEASMRDKLKDDFATLSESLCHLDQATAELQQTSGATINTYATIAGLKDLNRDVLLNPPPLEQNVLTSLGDPRSRELLAGLVHRLERIRAKRRDAAATLSGLETLGKDEFYACKERLNQCQHEGIGHLGFAEVLEVVRLLDQIENLMSSVLHAIEQAGSLPIPPPKTTKQIEGLRDFLTFIADETPIETELYICEELFDSGVPTLFQKAEANWKALENRRTRLQKIFTFDERDPLSPITDTVKQLEEGGRHLIPWLSSDYRHAVRWCESFSNESFPDAKTRLKRLRELVTCLKDVGEYVDNQEYRHGLGLLFIGMQTDWELGNRLITWREKLAECIPNLAVEECLKYTFADAHKKIVGLHDAAKQLLDDLPQPCKTLKQLLGKKADGAFRFDFSRTAPLASTLARVREAKTRLQQICADCEARIVDSTASIDDFVTALENEHLAQNDCADIMVAAERYQAALGDAFRGDQTNAAWVTRHLDWVQILVDANLPEPAIQWICETESPVRAQTLALLCADLMEAERQCESVVESFDRYGRLDLQRFSTGADGALSFDETIKKIERCCEDMESVSNWADFCRIFEEGRHLGMTPFLDTVDEGRWRDVPLLQAFRFVYNHSLGEAMLSDMPDLRSFGFEKLKTLRTQYTSLYSDSLDVNTDTIVRNLRRARPPQGNAHGPVSERTEMGLIRREISKVKRHLSIRALMSRAGEALQTLKPCFMMSPLSVAQFLPPGEIEFDLLIMDEASQLRPEECIGAVARARQVLVVGDPNQLSPTSFFDRVSDDADAIDEESALDNLESILDLFTQAYGAGRRLLWHYRSRHEDLIRFSNYHFYGNSLTLFPSPHPKAGTQGLELVRVEGDYKKGTNIREAEAVAQAVVEHAIHCPDRSLGVATLNSNQREAVLTCIDQAIAGKSKALAAYDALCNGAEPLFVKNLENVQGDERDVIFISYTYGPDEDGRLYQRFGPINGREGWRRLNVLFTRAREKIRLFSSFDPDMVNVSRKASRGVEMLRRYLEFAAGRHLTQGLVHDGRNARTPFQRAIGKVVESLGFACKTDVGLEGCCVDVAVHRPGEDGEYVLGILGDASLGSSASCNDRERLRYEVLQRLGWRLHTIHAIDWFRNRDREIQRLRRLLSEE